MSRFHQSALLEEQKSVMQHCAEERRKLAAEWAHFHTVEKQRHDRAEREVSSLLEKREGSILSLAQVSFRYWKSNFRLIIKTPLHKLMFLVTLML